MRLLKVSISLPTGVPAPRAALAGVEPATSPETRAVAPPARIAQRSIIGVSKEDVMDAEEGLLFPREKASADEQADSAINNTNGNAPFMVV
jgi:hypothetical protein